MLRIALVPFVLAALATVSRAETLHVPSQYWAIQHAVDAAATGDVVRVAPGVYHEAVVVQNKAIRLEAKGKVVIDGRWNGAWLGNCLKIQNAAGTVVDGFTLRHCGAGDASAIVRVLSTDVRLEDLRIVAGVGPGIAAVGARTQLLRCEVSGCHGGIAVSGAESTLDRCVVRQDGASGFTVEGDACSLTKCRVETVEDGHGVRIAGDGVVVEKLVVRGVSDDTGVIVAGPNASMRKSRITGVGNGNAAILVDAKSFTLEQSTIRDCGATAVYATLLSQGCHLLSSRFERCGTTEQPALVFTMYDAFVKDCVIRDADGHGILVLNDYTSLTHNRIERCRLDGIHVGPGCVSNDLIDNVVRDCLGEGIDVREIVDLEGNVAKGNRTDFVATVVVPQAMAKNKFGTTGTPQID